MHYKNLNGFESLAICFASQSLENLSLPMERVRSYLI